MKRDTRFILALGLAIWLLAAWTRTDNLATNQWSFAVASGGIVNTGTAVTMKAAGTNNTRNYVSGCQVSHATLGAATELAIRDGAGGTVLWRMGLNTTATPLTAVRFEPPLKGSADTLTEVVTITAVTGAVYVNCQGLTGG